MVLGAQHRPVNISLSTRPDINSSQMDGSLAKLTGSNIANDVKRRRRKRGRRMWRSSSLLPQSLLFSPGIDPGQADRPVHVHDYCMNSYRALPQVWEAAQLSEHHNIQCFDTFLLFRANSLFHRSCLSTTGNTLDWLFDSVKVNRLGKSQSFAATEIKWNRINSRRWSLKPSCFGCYHCLTVTFCIVVLLYSLSYSPRSPAISGWWAGCCSIDQP